MKVATIDKIRPPESIRFGEMPIPAAGPANALVEVSAVCVDPVDALIRERKADAALW